MGYYFPITTSSSPWDNTNPIAKDLLSKGTMERKIKKYLVYFDVSKGNFSPTRRMVGSFEQWCQVPKHQRKDLFVKFHYSDKVYEIPLPKRDNLETIEELECYFRAMVERTIKFIDDQHGVPPPAPRSHQVDWVSLVYAEEKVDQESSFYQNNRLIVFLHF